MYLISYLHILLSLHIIHMYIQTEILNAFQIGHQKLGKVRRTRENPPKRLTKEDEIRLLDEAEECFSCVEEIIEDRSNCSVFSSEEVALAYEARGLISLMKMYRESNNISDLLQSVIEHLYSSSKHAARKSDLKAWENKRIYFDTIKERIDIITYCDADDLSSEVREEFGLQVREISKAINGPISEDSIKESIKDLGVKVKFHEKDIFTFYAQLYYYKAYSSYNQISGIITSKRAQKVTFSVNNDDLKLYLKEIKFDLKRSINLYETISGFTTFELNERDEDACKHIIQKSKDMLVSTEEKIVLIERAIHEQKCLCKTIKDFSRSLFSWISTIWAVSLSPVILSYCQSKLNELKDRLTAKIKELINKIKQ